MRVRGTCLITALTLTTNSTGGFYRGAPVARSASSFSLAYTNTDRLGKKLHKFVSEFLLFRFRVPFYALFLAGADAVFRTKKL